MNMKRIEIMRSDAVVKYDGKEASINRSRGDLLRLLVLEEGALVSKDDVASLGRRARQRENSRSPIRDLREDLRKVGCPNIVITEDDGYRIDLDGWEVDTIEFERVAKRYPGALESILKGQLIESSVALQQIEELEHVIDRLWHGNPAAQLPATFRFASKFDTMKQKVENQLLMARLCSGKGEEIREATQILDHQIRRDDGSAAWALLMHAYHSLGTPVKAKGTWGKAVEHYNNGHGKKKPGAKNLPAEIMDAAEHIFGAKEQTPIFPVINSPIIPSVTDIEASAPRPDSELLVEICARLGITIASNLRLQGSQVSPEQAITRTRRRLYFSGVLASKWLLPGVREQFSELLTRLDTEKGEVRFLIINPSGKGFQRLRKLRGDKISAGSIGPLQEFVRTHKCFQVKMYDELPAFRIVAIDDDLVSFSPYRLAADFYNETEGGWGAPHIVLDPVAKYPLAEAFQLLFLENWRRAKNLPIGGAK